MSYRDAGLREMEALSALSAKAADLALSDDGSTEGFEAAVRELAHATPMTSRRLASAVEHYLTVIRLAHDLPTADEVPRSFPMPFTDDDLDLLRFALIRSVRRPAHLVQIAGWIQSLRGLPGDSTEELDIVARVLHDARSHDELVPILREMVARGDERSGTLMWLAQALAETGHWSEAKSLLVTRVGDRPGPEVVDLLHQLVMLCAATRDPEHEHWLETLRSVDAERARYGQAPPTMVEEAIEEPQLFARYEEGTLTIDPRAAQLGEQGMAAHIRAAIVLGLGPEKGVELLGDIQLREPDLY